MNNAEYKTMFQLETFYWWFVARRKLLSEVVAGLDKNQDHTVLLDENWEEQQSDEVGRALHFEAGIRQLVTKLMCGVASPMLQCLVVFAPKKPICRDLQAC